jgi:site-specific DNA-methyltransferase (adenine-specific)
MTDRRVVTIGNATLYLGDARELLSEITADACISDPPYGINLRAAYGQGTRKYPNGKRREPAKQYTQQVIGDDQPFDPTALLRFPVTLLWGAENYKAKLPDGGRWLVWDKRCGVIPERTQGDCEFAWCSRKGVSRVFRHIWDGMVRDSEQGQQRDHPTQKPIALMEWCIEQAGQPAVIVDPYMGSGTTGVAAMNMSRNFIGIEIDPGYFEVACERIAAAQAQGRLIA